MGTNRRPKRRPTHAAVVWWLDAVAEYGDDMVIEKKEKCYLRMSCGILAHEDEEVVVLTGCYDEEDDCHSDKTTIPRGMVQRMLRYKIRHKEKP